MSQQDVRFIAEFLDSFAPDMDTDEESDHEGPSNNRQCSGERTSLSGNQNHHHKCLERVGQYLKDEDLKQPVDRSKNPWHIFLNENPEFKEIPFIIQVNERSSLMQEYNKLNSAVRSIFSAMNCDTTEKCNKLGEIRFTSVHANIRSHLKLRQFSCTVGDGRAKIYGCVGSVSTEEKGNGDKLLLYELTCPINTVTNLEDDNTVRKHALKGLWISFEKMFSDNDPEVSINTKHLNGCSLIDCKFYTSDTVSILLNEPMNAYRDAPSSSRPGNDRSQRMIQLSLSDAEIYFRYVISMWN